MRMGARAHAYRFFKASLQILHFNFLLKRDVTDGVSLLAELAPEVLAVENGLRCYSGSKKKLSRLSLKHLNLALQSSAIILS